MFSVLVLKSDSQRNNRRDADHKRHAPVANYNLFFARAHGFGLIVNNNTTQTSHAAHENDS